MKGILILGRSKDFFARVDIAPFCDYTFPCKSVRWTARLLLLLCFLRARLEPYCG